MRSSAKCGSCHLEPVIECAIKVVKVITDTYSQPNKTPEEIEAMISNWSVDILRSFSEACREEFEQSLQRPN